MSKKERVSKIEAHLTQGGSSSIQKAQRQGGHVSPYAQQDPALSPFVRGGFTPAKKEIHVDELPVIGTVPRDLEGEYIKNGPNAFFMPAPNQPYHCILFFLFFLSSFSHFLLFFAFLSVSFMALFACLFLWFKPMR